MTKFNVGDRVICWDARLGVLEVESIKEDGKYTCVWHDKYGNLRTREFCESDLEEDEEIRPVPLFLSLR